MDDATGKIQIVVLDRSFVFVGRTTLSDTQIFIDEARCIRKWGTTNGLAELKDGPLSGTVLDEQCTVRAERRALLFTIDCNQQKWLKSFV